MGGARHRYASFHERLAHVKIDLSRDSGATWGSERLQVAGIEPPASVFAAASGAAPTIAAASSVQGTAFGTALQDWTEMNLSLPFQHFYEQVSPKAQSLVLLLHHRDEVVAAIDSALTLEQRQSWLAWDAVLDLVPRLAFDLGPEFMPVYPTCLAALLRATSLLDKNTTNGDEGLAAQLVERAFHSAAWVFRAVAPVLARSVPGAMLESWGVVRQFLADRRVRDESLGRAKGHTRRFASEAFAHLIRKAPVAHLEALAPAMVAEHPALQRAVATTWAHACTSVGHALHSRTPALLTLLLASRPVRLGERVVTALAHHASAAEFVPVVELLLEWLGADAADPIVSWLIAAVGTRKGTRIDDRVKPALFDGLQRALGRVDSAAYATLLCLALPLGRIQEMSSRGAAILQSCARAPARGAWSSVSVFSALDADWQGFAPFALPVLLDATAAVLPDGPAEHQETALVLLSELAAGGHLQRVVDAPPTNTTLRWSKRVRAAVISHAERLATGSDPVSVAAVRLAPLFPAAAAQILPPLVRATHEASLRLDTAQQVALAGALLDTLAATLPNKAHGVSETLRDAVPRFLAARSRAVLPGLARLVQACDVPLPAVDASWRSLQDAVLDSDRDVVLAALRLLERATMGTFNVFSLLIDVETTPLDVASVAARNVKLRHAQREAFKAGADALQMHALIRYTLGTLKLNFKPVWRESRATLVAIAARYGAEVWRASFDELTRHTVDADEPASVATKDDDEERDDEERDDDDGDEDEAEDAFDPATDPVLDDQVRRERVLGIRARLARGHEPPRAAAEAALSDMLSPRYRFVRLHYVGELLALYEQHPVIAEKNTAEFVPYVLSVWQGLIDSDYATLPAVERGAQLQHILHTFAQFRHPAAMHDAAVMHERFLALCAHPDLPVQRSALDCLGAWAHPWLTLHADRLKALLEPARFRDTLAYFSLGKDSDVIQKAHRAPLMQVVIRLLYGLMVSHRKQRTAGAGQAARRAAILNALSEATDGDRALLVDLMLAPLAYGTVTTVMLRRYAGFLALLRELLRQLGFRLGSDMPRLVHATIAIAAHAEDEAVPRAARRAVRQDALRRLAEFVRYVPSWAPYRDAVLDLVRPRLETLAVDSVQGLSALTELVRSWASDVDTQLVFYTDAAVLPSVYACFANDGIKPPVALALLETVQQVAAAAADERVRTDVLMPYATALLDALFVLVRRTIESTFAYDLGHARDELLRREVDVLCALAPHMDAAAAGTTLELLVPLVPHARVHERVKTELLRTFATLLPRTPLGTEPHAPAFRELHGFFCGLGAELTTRDGRDQLCAAYAQLARADPSLSRAAALLAELNAYSPRVLDEPDFERRIAAFDTITSGAFSLDEWNVFTHQALFFLGDDEMVLRSNGSAVLQSFAKAQIDGPAVITSLIGGVRRRLGHKSEFVRKEAVTVLGAFVEHLPPAYEPLGELAGLLGADAESSFFYNVYHIQMHRRVRALRRLGEYVASGAVSSKTTATLLIPLVWHFLVPAPNGALDMNLANEAIACIRRLSEALDWGAYSQTITRFLHQVREHAERPATERLHIRGVVGVLEAFHFSLTEETPLYTSVTTKLLPQLHALLDVRDDERIPPRLPLAVGACRIALNMPESRRSADVYKIFSIVGTMLRSKLQTTRDAARDAVLHLLRVAGPAYLGTMVRELRRLLTRGPQVAVCAYTVHNILAALGTASSGEPLIVRVDDGVPDMVAIAFEDVFGHTGEDRVAIENKTAVREMRQSKSLDTFDHLARLAAPPRLHDILAPMRDVLASTESPTVLGMAEECLRRISSGIIANAHLGASDLLVLCHTLIARGGGVFGREKQASRKRASVLESRKSAEAGPQRDHFAHNAHLFVALGLDLLTTALRRSRFDVHDDATIAKLMPLVSATGETLYTRHAAVVERGLRAVAGLSRCPIPNLDETMPVIIKQMLAIIRHAGSVHATVTKAALRSLAAVLRDCRAAAPSDAQLVELVRLVGPEVEDSDAQPTVFALLRALVSRQFVVPELYDVMDRVATLLVTSHDAQVRDVARALYLQFLLDYPQGGSRLRNQLAFLAKQVAYEREPGRLSVLELLGAIFAKFSEDVVRTHAELFFVALALQLENDESAQCRTQIAGLLRTLLAVLHDEQLHTTLRMVSAWSSSEKPPLPTLALRLYELLVSRTDASRMWLDDALRACRSGAVPVDDWHTPYHALQTMQAVLQHVPKSLPMLGEPVFEHIVTLLTYPHAWVRIAACRVVGAFFAGGLAPPLPVLVRTAQELAEQLRSPLLDDALTLQIVRNLVFIGKAFAAAPVSAHAEIEGGASSSEDESGGEDASDGEDESEDASPAAVDSATANPLAWLFTKLSYVARIDQHAAAGEQPPYKRAAAVFKWFAAMTTQLDVSRFLTHILTPLHRVVDDTSRGTEHGVSLLTSRTTDPRARSARACAVICRHARIRGCIQQCAAAQCRTAAQSPHGAPHAHSNRP